MRANTLDLIRTGGWKVVVLQESCTVAVLNPSEFVNSTRSLDGIIRESGGQTALFMLWGNLIDARITTESLAEATSQVGQELGLLVVPVGLAWQRAMNERPALDLYANDGMRANLHGRYLAAAVFYATLLGRDPQGIKYFPKERATGMVVTAKDAAFLQRIAWETVQAYPPGE